MNRKWAYYCAVFLSAFLLFQIQPMISKALLPVFGGSYLVWAVCMVFFQLVLLLGYIYAHSIQRKFGVARYSRWHWVFLLLPFIVFPFKFGQIASGLPQMSLVVAIPMLLLFNVGIPFLVLSTGSIILQSWFHVSRLPGSKNPYTLYGASNLGSMLALLTYPIFFEPLFDLNRQGQVWWIGYTVLIGLFLFCRPGVRDKEVIEEGSPSEKESSRRMLGWLLLAASGTAALLAVTNVITFDIASVPFLWVLPLSVYLLTFVLVFKQKIWYPKWIKDAFSWSVSLGFLLYIMGFLRLGLPAAILLPMQLIILFVVCINCHGKLIEIKPRDTRNLTLFYIVMASGGFIGSLIVSTIVPLVTTSLLEYPMFFFMAALAMAITGEKESGKNKVSSNNTIIAWTIVGIVSMTLLPWLLKHFLAFPPKIIFVCIAGIVLLTLRRASKEPWMLVFVVCMVMVSSQWTEELSVGAAKTKKLRNFYGIYRVYETGGQKYLQHGTTLHGRQYLEGSKVSTPLSFYHPSTPVGNLLRTNPFNAKNIGMIGLGTGALGAYMEKGQKFTIYELDPDNLGIAEDNFSYLSIARDRGAEIDFVFGDGRIALGDVDSSSYDIFIVDAFNSGSIPVHLLTLEALREYLRVLKPDGILLMHISNRALDLAPVIYRVAQELGFYACEKTNEGNVHPDSNLTIWMAISRDKNRIKILVNDHQWISRQDEIDSTTRPWTDQYTDLLGALR